MPVNLELPTALRRARWKVKILEKETREPPHVTILRRTQKWRIDLRTGEFMDRRPDPSDVPESLINLIRTNWQWLCEQWDEKYPENPVEGADD
ncbi:MAG: hypothetical protein ACREJB_06820 [Planctomycetaceae bacterium]